MNEISSWSLQEWTKAFEREFTNTGNLPSCLYHALLLKKNVIAYGPGGHAKSEMIKYGLKELLHAGDEAEYQNHVYKYECSPHMDVKPFLGFTSLPEFRQGRHVTVFDDTVWVKAKYLVLEEGLSAPEELLLFMRDTIFSGTICQGSRCVKTNLSSIFIATNVFPQSWAGQDLNRLALLQRFSYESFVKWDRYEADDFYSMYHKDPGISDTNAKYLSMIMEFLHTQCSSTRPLSPRTAKLMALDYEVAGIEALLNYPEVTSNTLQKFLHQMEEKKQFYIDLYSVSDKLREIEQGVSNWRYQEDCHKTSSDLEGLLGMLTTNPIEEGDYGYKLAADTTKKVVELLRTTSELAKESALGPKPVRTV